MRAGHFQFDLPVNTRNCGISLNTADKAGAVAHEAVKAMQDPHRRLLAQLKQARNQESRLGTCESAPMARRIA